MALKITELPADAYTDIVQLPAFKMANGSVTVPPPDMLKLKNADLNAAAAMLGATVVWFKMRATYSVVENPLCTYKDCFRPATSDGNYCGDHPKGIKKK